MASNHMKQQAYHSCYECEFVEGDQVFLHLQPYKQTSLKDEHCHNRAPKFYGLYTILKRVGPVSYQLPLPSHCKLHLIFHASCLNKVIGTKC